MLFSRHPSKCNMRRFCNRPEVCFSDLKLINGKKNEGNKRIVVDSFGRDKISLSLKEKVLERKLNMFFPYICSKMSLARLSTEAIAILNFELIDFLSSIYQLIHCNEFPERIYTSLLFNLTSYSWFFSLFYPPLLVSRRATGKELCNVENHFPQ